MQTNGLTLVADIGGTHARFALSSADAQMQCAAVLLCTDYVHISDAIVAYLADVQHVLRDRVDAICLAVAAPAEHDLIRMTNHHWVFSRTELSAHFRLPVQVINDFSAQAWLLSRLPQYAVEWLQPPFIRALTEPAAVSSDSAITWTGGTRTITGPGTGFGGASLTQSLDVLSSEPGHVAFAPLDALQMQILDVLWEKFPRVSVEHLISGPGLANIYWALKRIRGGDRSESRSAAAIVKAADQGDSLSMECLAEFSRIFGAVCGDMALSVGCQGGLFISGDMLKKLGQHFDKAAFMQAFVNKGAFRSWCEQVPVGLLQLADPGLHGCALYAARWRAASQET